MIVPKEWKYIYSVGLKNFQLRIKQNEKFHLKNFL